MLKDVRIEVRPATPDSDLAAGGDVLAVLEDHPRGWTLRTPRSQRQCVTLDQALEAVMNETHSAFLVITCEPRFADTPHKSRS